MKVLHVGSGNLYGGVEKVLLTLAQERHLCPQMEPYFAVCFRGRFSEELQKTGASVFFLNEMSGRKPFSIAQNRIALGKLRSHLGVNAIVYHSLWSYDLLGIGARTGATQKVLWLHDAINHIGGLETVARFQQPDLLVSNSLFTAGTASALYSTISPVVIYCPVVPQSFSSYESLRRDVRRRCETNQEDVVIIQQSRLEWWKGHRLHLDALSHLKDLPQWTLWIAGGAQRPDEKQYLDELKSQAERLGILERIRFLGQRTDIAELLAGADIHCQPNLGAEPFGITFIEAMNAGLPIVTTKIGAAPELIDESCGLLSEPNDVFALAENLRKLIVNDILRRQLGGNGPARAERLCSPSEKLRELFECLARNQMSWNKRSAEVAAQ